MTLPIQVTGIVVGLGLLFFGLFGCWPASAHGPIGWEYDPSCCRGHDHGGDCDAIPHSAVRVVDGVYEITLMPGDHPLVTKPHRWTRAITQTRMSQDEDFHACLYPTEDDLKCLYAPPMGF